MGDSGIPNQARKKDPLEGKTLETILNELVAHYGWEELYRDYLWEKESS